MTYADGQPVRVGDRVRLSDDAEGEVVCSLDTSEFTKSFRDSEWAYLETGVLVLSPQLGLVHYQEDVAPFSLRGAGS